MAAHSGFRKFSSFDMGGTSTDVAAVQGEVRTGAVGKWRASGGSSDAGDSHGGRRGGSRGPVRCGRVAARGAGIGGGRSGPICYGRNLATVTDANLLMGGCGRRFLGGEFQLDWSERTITSEWLRRKVRLSVEQFSAGIVRVVNANMERALRVVSIERGYIRESLRWWRLGSGRAACLRTRRGVGDSTVMIRRGRGAFGVWDSGQRRGQGLIRAPCSGGLRVGSQAAAGKLEKEFRKLEAAAGKEFRAKGGTAGRI